MSWRRLRSGMLFPTAVGGLTSVSFQDSAISPDDTITAPSSIDSGDLLVMLDLSGYAGGGPVTPSGWTSIGTADGTYIDAALSYKIADGTEDSSSITGIDFLKYGLGTKIILQFRANTAISSVTVQDLDQEVVLGNPTSQTLTSSGGTTPLISFGCYGSTIGDVSSNSFSPTADGTIEGTVDFYGDAVISYKIYDSSPANITIDMDADHVENYLASFYLELS